MTRHLVWVDLCSGLGGASQPALDRGWRVIRIDIDARFKPDIVADVRHLPLKPFHVDVLWASPPCTEFTRYQLRCFYPKATPPALGIELMKAAWALRRITQPYVWFIENVRSSVQWMRPIFGEEPRFKSTGHAIWSNFWSGLPAPTHKGYRHGYWKGRKAEDRAKIPYEIGEAICAAVERRSIEELALRSVADGEEVAAAGSAQGRVVVPANVQQGRS